MWAATAAREERRKPQPETKKQSEECGKAAGSDLNILNPLLQSLHLVVEFGGVAEVGKVLLLLLNELFYQLANVPILCHLEQAYIRNLIALKAFPFALLGPFAGFEGWKKPRITFNLPGQKMTWVILGFTAGHVLSVPTIGKHRTMHLRKPWTKIMAPGRKMMGERMKIQEEQPNWRSRHWGGTLELTDMN